jgi:hemolysin activation/secretion protein
MSNGRGWVLSLLLGCLVSTAIYAQTEYEPVRFDVSRFVVSGDNPIGDDALGVLQSYTGEQYGLEGLSAAADALERELTGRGFSFHRVSLPPQKLDSGVIELKIVRFAIGAVNIEGNQFFDEENIRHSMPELSSGGTPNTKELSRSLKLANNHAAKNLVLKFSEGEAQDSIDANITVTDRDPQIFFVTLDNTGNEDTEEIRTTVGYQHGNLFNRDHAITATLTVAPEDPSATAQIGANYHIPLYQHGASLDFLVSDSEIDSGEVGSGISVSGKGSVVGFSYVRPMLSDSNFNHRWSAGFKNKVFENELDLSGSITTTEVRSFPLEIGYGFEYLIPRSSISGGLVYASNIDSGSNNTDTDYATVRTGATTDWAKLNFNLAYDLLFAGEWVFHLGLSGQDSSDKLISGEQYGVGGSGTLRGFEERSVTGDSGHQVSLEFWTPPISGFRYLLFFDQASVELNDGEDYDLSSYGLGLRWAWKQQLSLSLDYGVINEGGGPDPDINNDDDDRAHFNLIYRF